MRMTWPPHRDYIMVARHCWSSSLSIQFTCLFQWRTRTEQLLKSVTIHSLIDVTAKRCWRIIIQRKMGAVYPQKSLCKSDHSPVFGLFRQNGFPDLRIYSFNPETATWDCVESHIKLRKDIIQIVLVPGEFTQLDTMHSSRPDVISLK